MNPIRLAWRNVLLGGPRGLVSTLLIAASLCLLDLFAGHIASERTRLEYQAVVGERLGHLILVRSGGTEAFDAAEAKRIKRIVEQVKGVALVVPQVHLAGVASTGTSSAFFSGAGIGPTPPGTADVVADQPGRLQPDRPNGIAVSSGQARTLGLRNGSAVTLTGVAPDARPVPLNARVVDIFNAPGLGASARSLLMPLELAQGLLNTGRTERLAVYLSVPRELDARRAELADALRDAGVAVEVSTWRELSAGYASADWAARLKLACVTAAVLAFVWATVAATASMNGLEGRAQLATLRALGMRRRAVFGMIAAEALWMAMLGAAIGLTASSLIAWVVNRAAVSFATEPSLAAPRMLVELDFNAMGAALAAVLAVAALAALLPAFRAARADVARGLRCDHGHPGW